MQQPAPLIRRRPSCAGVLALGAVVCCASLAAPLAARAQESPTDPSTDLFRQGRQLLNDGRFPQACEKFRESLALRRSPGTLLNVGNCLEFEGRFVEALEVFSEARTLAAAEPDARKAAAWTSAADEEIAAIERRIATVTVSAVDPALQVTLDGEPLTTLGAPLRLNPGRHRVEARADGKQPFERELDLAEGQAELLEIPPLAELPAPVAAQSEPQIPIQPQVPVESVAQQPVSPAITASPAPDRLPAEGEPRVWPWVVIGAGAAVFAGGAVTGIVAADMQSDLEEQCPMETCEGEIPSLRDRGQRTAIVADVLMLSGVVTAAVGTVWLLLSEDDSRPALAAGCSRAGCQAQVSGRF